MKQQEQEMINHRAHGMTTQFMSLVQSLSGMPQANQFWHLNNMGIQADEESIESYLHKLGGLKYEQIHLLNTFLLTPIPSLTEGISVLGEEELRGYYK